MHSRKHIQVWIYDIGPPKKTGVNQNIPKIKCDGKIIIIGNSNIDVSAKS